MHGLNTHTLHLQGDQHLPWSALLSTHLQRGPRPHLSVRKQAGLASPKVLCLTGVSKYSLVLYVYWHICCLYNFIHELNKFSCLLWKHNFFTTHRNLVRRPCPCECEEWRRQEASALFCILYTHTWLLPVEHTHTLCRMYLYYNIMYIKSKYEKDGQRSGLGEIGDQEKGDGAVSLGGRPLWIQIQCLNRSLRYQALSANSNSHIALLIASPPRTKN